MNKSVRLLAITGVAILIVNLAGCAAPRPPKEENAIDYVQPQGVDAGPGYPWKNWFGTNTHGKRAIRFTVRFTLEYRSYDAEPGERKPLGNCTCTPTVVGARFISR